jgi:rare lipoprotein A
MTWHTLARWLLSVVVTWLAAGCSVSHPTIRPDGPPDRVPGDLVNLPDPQPRVEPLNPHANHPYVALGKTYTPDTHNRAYDASGLASWYGKAYQGSRTASGEPYDMFQLTAAHPTLPIPSYARVTRSANGNSVIVRINDRGPFVDDRIIDLSYAAAVRLGLDRAGVAEVTVHRITDAEIPQPAPNNAGPRVIYDDPTPLLSPDPEALSGTGTTSTGVGR